MMFGPRRQPRRGGTNTEVSPEVSPGTSTRTPPNPPPPTINTTATSAEASWWRWLPSLQSSSPSPPWSSGAGASSDGATRGGGGGGGGGGGASSGSKLPCVVAGNLALVTAACAWLVSSSLLGVNGQPDKYMTAASWKEFLSEGGDGGASWFERWNAMAQPRIDQLASLAEAEAAANGRKGAGDTGMDGNGDRAEPFRVAMVGDSTMMQQHGVICAFLGERTDRRFDPAMHQEECCIDTLPRRRQLQAVPAAKAGGDTSVDISPGENHNNTSKSGDNGDVEGPGLSVGGGPAGSGVEGEGDGAGAEGGRGLCFRHAFQKFAAPPEWEAELWSPDAVYFGSGLHFLHMARPGHGLEAPRVQGWLTYEEDLQNAVETYRAEGGDDFRLVFMTSHTIQDTVYEGEFKKVVEGYRKNDAELISACENQMQWAAGGSVGPRGYGADSYCRQALLDRNGSEVLNRRSRPVMEKLGVPLVESDLIVKDQAWATPRMDGRHYHMLVPVEVWELLGVLVSPFDNGVALESAR